MKQKKVCENCKYFGKPQTRDEKGIMGTCWRNKIGIEKEWIIGCEISIYQGMREFNKCKFWE